MKNIIKEWQQSIFESIDFLLIFSGVFILLKTLVEEGVIA